MEIEIKHNSDIPIYMQLYEKIKEQIIYGKLKRGDKLPSYRELAKLCNVSLVTVTKAYGLLNEEKLIVASQQGCFISENAAAIAVDYHMQQIEDKLKAAIGSAKTVDISLDELHILINELWNE